MHKWGRVRGIRRGQSVVEMAAVVMVITTLMMGVIELGFLLHAYITVVNLGRDGARIAIDGATTCEIRDTLSTEAARRLSTFGSDGAVYVVRGNTISTGVVPTPQPAPTPDTAWQLSAPNPSNSFSLKTQRTGISGLRSLDGTAGINFVLVEVHYRYRTITKLPFAQEVPVSTRTIIRTGADVAGNSHTC